MGNMVLTATANQPEHLTLIGIGASFHATRSLSALLKAMPSNCPFCMVVICPGVADGEGLLARLSDEARGPEQALHLSLMADGMVPRPGVVFLVPPGQLAELRDGAFTLRPSGAGDRPVDFFFASLAGRDPGRDFAVILSGSGDDGTLGARTLREAGGMILAQSPQEAGNGAMPGAALQAGTVNRVLPVAEIPQAIQDRLNQGRPTARGLAEIRHTSAHAIVAMLEKSHGMDGDISKVQSLLTGIERFRAARQFATMSDLHQQLLARDGLLEELRQEIFHRDPSFYRDPNALEVLSRGALAPMIRRCAPDDTLRVWVPGCAGGQEAYTIAIEIAEAMRAEGVERNFRVIATDRYRPTLETASAGRYPAAALAGVPVSIRNRYFRKDDDVYEVLPELRQRVVFSVHDLLADPPFMQLDLVVCRGELAMLNEETQMRILSMFIFGLRPGGYLFLGARGRLGRQVIHFQIVDSRSRLFRCTAKGQTGHLPHGVSRPLDVTRARPVSGRSDFMIRDRDVPRDVLPRSEQGRGALLRCYDALLARHAPGSIIVAPWGQVMAWFGEAGRYLNLLSAGEDRSVGTLVHHDLQLTLISALGRLRQHQLSVLERDVNVLAENGETHVLSIRAEPLPTEGGPEFLMFGLERRQPQRGNATLKEVTPKRVTRDSRDPEALQRRIRELERDLHQTEQALNAMSRKLDISASDLQSSSEELVASNEELHATNEELQSSNEALLALNEQLVSHGTAHEQRLGEYVHLARQTERIFEGLGVGILLLDGEMTISRVTELARRAFDLSPADLGLTLSAAGVVLPFADVEGLAASVRDTGVCCSLRGTLQGAPVTMRISPASEVDGGGVMITLWMSGMPEEGG